MIASFFTARHSNAIVMANLRQRRVKCF